MHQVITAVTNAAGTVAGGPIGVICVDIGPGFGVTVLVADDFRTDSRSRGARPVGVEPVAVRPAGVG